MKRDPQSSPIPTPRLNQGFETFKPFVSFWRNLFSHLYDGLLEIPDLGVNFKTEVCAKSTDPQFTVQRIKEVETAKSMDELVTSRSLTKRTNFSDSSCDDCVCIEQASHQFRAFPQRAQIQGVSLE